MAAVTDLTSLAVRGHCWSAALCSVAGDIQGHGLMGAGCLDGHRKVLTAVYTQTLECKHFISGNLCCLLISSNIVIFQCVTLGRASNSKKKRRSENCMHNFDCEALEIWARCIILS